MIQEHFNELRTVVQQAEGLPEATRTRLLQLAADLEQEAAQLGSQSADQQDRPESDEEPSSANALVSAIEGFEASHPEVTAAVNNTATMLSKLGF